MPAKLDDAFESLKTFDWGADLKTLAPIDEAVVATAQDDAARSELENRLADVLSADVSRDAKDFACRKLMAIGTAASVEALAKLLSQADYSHMARYALERIPAPEAARALRDSLATLSGALKAGVIGSLGVRGDGDSVPALAKLLGDDDATVACAAACALGAIRSPQAVQALAQSKPTAPEAKRAAVDASFACAERLLADGKKTEALALYKQFAGEDRPKHVRLAATRGMLACAGSAQ